MFIHVSYSFLYSAYIVVHTLFFKSSPRVAYQSEGFRNGVMLSLGALEYGVVGDGQVVLLLLLLLLLLLPACAAGQLKRWPSNLISFSVYS